MENNLYQVACQDHLLFKIHQQTKVERERKRGRRRKKQKIKEEEEKLFGHQVVLEVVVERDLALPDCCCCWAQQQLIEERGVRGARSGSAMAGVARAVRNAARRDSICSRGGISTAKTTAANCASVSVPGSPCTRAMREAASHSASMSPPDGEGTVLEEDEEPGAVPDGGGTSRVWRSPRVTWKSMWLPS